MINLENLDTSNIELSDFFMEYFSEDQDIVTLPNGKKALAWRYKELLQKNGCV